MDKEIYGDPFNIDPDKRFRIILPAYTPFPNAIPIPARIWNYTTRSWEDYIEAR